MIENQVQSVHAVQVTNSLRGIKIYQPSSPKRHLRDEVLLKARGTGTKLKEPAITTSQCWCAPCLQPWGSEQSAPKIMLRFSLLLVRQVTKLHSFHLFFLPNFVLSPFVSRKKTFLLETFQTSAFLLLLLQHLDVEDAKVKCWAWCNPQLCETGSWEPPLFKNIPWLHCCKNPTVNYHSDFQSHKDNTACSPLDIRAKGTKVNSSMSRKQKERIMTRRKHYLLSHTLKLEAWLPHWYTAHNLGKTKICLKLTSKWVADHEGSLHANNSASYFK